MTRLGDGQETRKRRSMWCSSAASAALDAALGLVKGSWSVVEKGQAAGVDSSTGIPVIRRARATVRASYSLISLFHWPLQVIMVTAS